jgi:hypothetical protein
VLAQVRLDERTDNHNLQPLGVSRVDGRLRQRGGEMVAAQRWRHFGVHQHERRSRAFVRENSRFPDAVRFRDSESAFALQPALDLVKPPFTGPQRRRAGMHRVLSEHEVVGVRSRRPKNKFRIGVRLDVDRAV